jgi:hypothetical protein
MSKYETFYQKYIGKCETCKYAGLDEYDKQLLECLHPEHPEDDGGALSSREYDDWWDWVYKGRGCPHWEEAEEESD